MNFSPTPEKNNTQEIKKDKYLDLVNDFGFFITLNASKLEQQINPGKEKDLLEIREVLRKPIINGLNYGDFTSQFAIRLVEPEISKTLISQIYNFLQYLEPRLDIFKKDAQWVLRFQEIRKKYVDLAQS